MNIQEEKRLFNMTSFEAEAKRRVDVVSNGDGSYYVGFNLPTIAPEDTTLTRGLKFTKMPHITVMGPFTDYGLAVLSARAFYLKDPKAVAEFEEHTRDVVRRAVSMIWQFYNADNRFAVDLSSKLSVPQHKKMTKTLTQTSV